MRAGQARFGRRAVLAAGAAAGVTGVTGLPAAPARALRPDGEAVAVEPGAARYSDLIRGNNQRWTAHPERVVLPVSTAQVVAAVQRAVSAGKRVTVRSGGHCYEDFAYNADTQVVIDLSEMSGVGYDAGRKAFFVEPGAIVMDVYDTLYRKWGVTIPAGMCYSVGMGGHVSGGGWGLLCRKFGLSVDHLHAVEVVTVDRAGTARAVVATNSADDPRRDLWWGHTGGGGGSFGIVTRFWFRTPGVPDDSPLLPVPPAEVYVHVLAWPWAQMTEAKFTRLLSNYGRWHEENSRFGGKYDGLMSFLAMGHRSNGQISLRTQMDATVPGASRLLDDFVAAVNAGVGADIGPLEQPLGEFTAMPGLFTAQRLPWLRATRMLGVTNPTLANPTLRGDFKSAYYRRSFPAAHSAAMYRHLTRDDFANPNALLVASSFGGKVNTVAPGATATVHRDSVMKLLYQTYWADPAQDSANLKWIRDFYQDVYASTGGVPVDNEVTGGTYINYADIDLNDSRFNRSGSSWAELYFGANYPRLQRVKGRWDPRDVFRHGQSIRLPGHE